MSDARPAPQTRAVKPPPLEAVAEWVTAVYFPPLRWMALHKRMSKPTLLFGSPPCAHFAKKRLKP
ncbi:hypothetical protein D3C71_222010 [compost metagenome]